jgi:hypothetical protein
MSDKITCGRCNKPMEYNVPRLGINGGLLHSETHSFSCAEPDRIATLEANVAAARQEAAANDEEVLRLTAANARLQAAYTQARTDYCVAVAQLAERAAEVARLRGALRKIADGSYTGGSFIALTALTTDQLAPDLKGKDTDMEASHDIRVERDALFQEKASLRADRDVHLAALKRCEGAFNALIWHPENAMPIASELLKVVKVALGEDLSAPDALHHQRPLSDEDYKVLHTIIAPTDQPAPDAPRPRIVCLCGSTRFKDAFDEANYQETMAGHIVLSVGFYMHATGNKHGEQIGATPDQKVRLDELHKRKIDLADEILVLNVGGYIGDSTRSEIDYAERHGKPVRWLEPVATKPAPDARDVGEEDYGSLVDKPIVHPKVLIAELVGAASSSCRRGKPDVPCDYIVDSNDRCAPCFARAALAKWGK